MTALNLTTNPLHFSTVPAEGKPPHAELLGTGLLLAWVADRVGLPKKLASTPHAKKLAAREITGRELLVAACKSKLTTEDVPAEVGKFLYGYTHRLFLGDDEGDTRAAAAKEIKKLLGLERTDEISFSDDYLATFKKVVKNPFLVPDTWEAFERFAPILDARWKDYQQTKFTKPPPKGIYAAAAKKRDAQKITVPKKAASSAKAKEAASGLFTEALTNELLGIVGKSLTDASVKAALAKVELPIGKKINEQAAPKNGLAYLGAKFPIGRERKLGVANMQFYKKGQKRYIRGLGAEVAFAQYPGPLPKGITFEDDAKAVRKKVGVKPESSSHGYDRFVLTKQGARLLVSYARNKVSSVTWATLRDDDD